MTDVFERYCDECGVVERVPRDELVTDPDHPWRRRWLVFVTADDKGRVCRKHFCKECRKVAKAEIDALRADNDQQMPEPPKIEDPPPIEKPKRKPAKPKPRSVPAKAQPRPQPKPEPDKWLL
jgi:hypothetical protein